MMNSFDSSRYWRLLGLQRSYGRSVWIWPPVESRVLSLKVREQMACWGLVRQFGDFQHDFGASWRFRHSFSDVRPFMLAYLQRNWVWHAGRVRALWFHCNFTIAPVKAAEALSTTTRGVWQSSILLHVGLLTGWAYPLHHPSEPTTLVKYGAARPCWSS